MEAITSSSSGPRWREPAVWVQLGLTMSFLYFIVRSATSSLGAARAALLEKHRALSTLVSNLPGVVYRCVNDEQWTMEYISQGCLELTGYPADDLVGNRQLSYAGLIDPADRDMVWNRVQEAVRAGQPFQLMYRIHAADGTIKWVWEQGRGVLSDAGDIEMLEGYITDITARRELEERLRQGQRMESLGRVAGGVAHDFNNIILAIAACAELLDRRLGDADPAREDVREIKLAVASAKELVAQLLAFARQQERAPLTLDLNALIRRMQGILGRIAGGNELSAELAADLGKIRADPSQIEQVLLNLVTNANDAMPNGGGRIEIDTRNVAIVASPDAELPAGDYVCLTVSDSGMGMDLETMTRAFEPFYTTKPEGKGTGLGLASVYGIVKQSGGGIEIDSQPGRGTSFRVYLPRSGADAQSAAA